MIMTRQKKKQIHYRDITNAYSYWEVDNYNEARLMLWEKLPYMIWKICNKYNYIVDEDAHSHVYEYLDDYLVKWWSNIDSTIRNAINDYWLKDQIVDCTHYSLAVNKAPITVTTTWLDISVDSDVEHYAHVSYLSDEIKASLWLLEDKEREMFIAHYLRKPPMTFNELSEVFDVERHKVSNIIRTARLKLLYHMKEYEFH